MGSSPAAGGNSHQRSMRKAAMEKQVQALAPFVAKGSLVTTKVVPTFWQVAWNFFVNPLTLVILGTIAGVVAVIFLAPFLFVCLVLLIFALYQEMAKANKPAKKKTRILVCCLATPIFGVCLFALNSILHRPMGGKTTETKSAATLPSVPVPDTSSSHQQRPHLSTSAVQPTNKKSNKGAATINMTDAHCNRCTVTDNTIIGGPGGAIAVTNSELKDTKIQNNKIYDGSRPKRSNPVSK